MRLRLLDPFGWHLSEEKKKSPSLIARLLSCDLFCIPYSLHHPSSMLLEMVVVFFFPPPLSSLLGFQVILTFDICNNNKKYIYV